MNNGKCPRRGTKMEQSLDLAKRSSAKPWFICKHPPHINFSARRKDPQELCVVGLTVRVEGERFRMGITFLQPNPACWGHA